MLLFQQLRKGLELSCLPGRQPENDLVGCRCSFWQCTEKKFRATFFDKGVRGRPKRHSGPACPSDSKQSRPTALGDVYQESHANVWSLRVPIHGLHEPAQIIDLRTGPHSRRKLF